MRRAAGTDLQQTRRRVAVEAARLITESGLRDYRLAKEKAAARLGVFDQACLPRNSDIDAALREHQRLFGGESHTRTLKFLREQAIQALHFFAAHEPRLVGAVLDGSADAHSAVCLHLYSDRYTEIIDLLTQRGIPFEEITRRLRTNRDATHEFPALRFNAGTTTIDVTVLPYDLLRQAPLDRISEKPMRRATRAMVEQLMRESPDDAG